MGCRIKSMLDLEDRLDIFSVQLEDYYNDGDYICVEFVNWIDEDSYRIDTVKFNKPITYQKIFAYFISDILNYN